MADLKFYFSSVGFSGVERRPDELVVENNAHQHYQCSVEKILWTRELISMTGSIGLMP